MQKEHLVQNTLVPRRLAQACGRHPVAWHYDHHYPCLPLPLPPPPPLLLLLLLFKPPEATPSSPLEPSLRFSTLSPESSPRASLRLCGGARFLACPTPFYCYFTSSATPTASTVWSYVLIGHSDEEVHWNPRFLVVGHFCNIGAVSKSVSQQNKRSQSGTSGPQMFFCTSWKSTSVPISHLEDDDFDAFYTLFMHFIQDPDSVLRMDGCYCTRPRVELAQQLY